MNILCIKTKSGISSDGFSVRIQDEEDNKLIEQNYNYGYNASYNKSWSDSIKPYTTDILVDLVNIYNVEKIIVTAGTYVFSGKPMTDKDVEDFINTYIIPNAQLVEILSNNI